MINAKKRFQTTSVAESNQTKYNRVMSSRISPAQRDVGLAAEAVEGARERSATDRGSDPSPAWSLDQRLGGVSGAASAMACESSSAAAWPRRPTRNGCPIAV
jgi:hypothetical protein